MGAARFATMFAALAAREEGAFVPFLMLGDPDLETSARLLDALVEAGADALELGLPFSDPVADGPLVQAAATRALAAGVTPDAALELVADLRERHAELPVGLLTYANLVHHRGADDFYARASAAGVDAALVADLPLAESAPFAAAARSAGVAPVFIAPPGATPELIGQVAKASEGFVYCVARQGVTGDGRHEHSEPWQLEALAEAGAPPALLGFGISEPEHVRSALSAGAAGAISGSAVVRRLAENLHDGAAACAAVAEFTRAMKRATRADRHA